MSEIAIRCGIAVIGTHMPMRVADDDAENQTGRDPAVVDDRVVEQRAGDGEQHADRRLLHAAARLVGPRETAQSENEQDRRDEVAALDEEVAHYLRLPGFRCRLCFPT